MIRKSKSALLSLRHYGKLAKSRSPLTKCRKRAACGTKPDNVRGVSKMLADDAVKKVSYGKYTSSSVQWHL